MIRCAKTVVIVLFVFVCCTYVVSLFFSFNSNFLSSDSVEVESWLKQNNLEKYIELFRQKGK